MFLGLHKSPMIKGYDSGLWHGNDAERRRTVKQMHLIASFNTSSRVGHKANPFEKIK